MIQIKGTDTAIMLAFEATYNTKPATPAGFLLPFDTCSVIASQGQTENNTILNGRTKGKPGLGNLDVAGAVNANLGAKSAAIWFTALLGGRVKSGSGPYQYDFTVAEDVPSFMLQKDLGKQLSDTRYDQNGGLKVASLDIQFSQEGYQKITANVKGASQLLTSTTLDTNAIDYRTETPWDGISVSVMENDVEVGIINSGNISINNNLDESSGYTIPKESEPEKAGQRQSLGAQQLTSEGAFTALLTDTAFIEKSINNQTSSLQLKFKSGDGTGTLGNECLILDLPTIVYQRTSADIPGPAGMMISMSFQSFGAITATLTSPEDL